MKHLFFVHTYVTFITARLVIEEKKLRDDDIVFLCDRNFKYANRQWGIFDIPEKYNRHNFPTCLNIFKSLKKTSQYFKYIDTATDSSSYHAYVPSTKDKNIQLLINYSKCQAFSIIEEGSFCYIDKDEIKSEFPDNNYTLLEFFGFWGKLKNKVFIDEDYEVVYGLNELSFPGYDRREILKFEEITKYINKNPYRLFNNSAIIVLEASSVYGELNTGVYIYCLVKMLNMLVDKGITDVYYKMHPSQVNTNEEDLIAQIFSDYEDKININKLGEQVCLEYILLVNSNITVVHNFSSVGVYASLLGHTVYSVMNTACKLDSGFKKVIDIYPSVLAKNFYEI